MIEVGDLVEWGILNINPNDCAHMFRTIKSGERLDHLPVGHLTTIVKHTGMISNINDFDVTILDFTGKQEVHMLIEDAEYKLTILNKK
jgi:hypothetical protein